MIDELIEFCSDYSIDRYQDAKHFVEELLKKYSVVPIEEYEELVNQCDDCLYR